MNNKVYWTKEEDNYLIETIHSCLNSNSYIKWKTVFDKMHTLYKEGVISSDKSLQQCTSRWHNYLKNQLDNWNRTTDDRLIELNNKYGLDWDKILCHFPDRLSTEVFKRFSYLYKRKLRIILTDIHGPLDRSIRTKKILAKLFIFLAQSVCCKDLTPSLVEDAFIYLKDLKFSNKSSNKKFSPYVQNTDSFMIMNNYSVLNSK